MRVSLTEISTNSVNRLNERLAKSGKKSPSVSEGPGKTFAPHSNYDL